MKIIVTLFFLVCSSCVNAQLLTWSPAFIQESSSPVEIILDATKGNMDLQNYTPTTDVYVHTGVITTLSANASDWKYSKFAWGVANPAAQCTYVGANKWKYTITGGLRAFYGITNTAEKILKIAILFRNGAGTKVHRNSDASDMYVPVYEAGLNVRIDEPFREPRFTPTLEAMNKTLGDVVAVNAKSSASATLKIFFNGTQVGTTATNATTVTANATISSYGNQVIVAEATTTSETKRDTVTFFVTPPVNTAPLPAGVRDGINYETGDTSVTLVLFAPFKTRVALLGDFNNWMETSRHQMNRTPDSTRYWIRLTGLTPGVEYGYQFLIDGSIKVADYMTEKVLDPFNDQYIPAANYPNLKPYPIGKTAGVVSVLQTAKPSFSWQVNNFAKPDKRNLIIYELLVRDFVATQNWQTVKDSIAYLKRLGVNAIEVMPFNEFEGNNSWGYNPDFFFAPDKMYGTETALRQFIDECHKQGIAVIMDMVMNHAFGLSPTVQMYFNSATNQPSANNPWHNEVPKHPFNVGYDFNHESQATKDLVDRVVEHWLTSYKVDGFRWDLSKGFTQTNSGSNVGAWGNYDTGRVAIWKRIYNKMQATVPGSYCILEHFAANNEEIELSNYGMMLWGNANHDYNEATMGYVSTSNFQNGLYTYRGWSQPHLVTYQESHDEERLMFKNITYGNTANPAYNAKNLDTALMRNAMATAFWAVQPAPKMIWQFGELGYDYSINTCENGTIAEACRTSPKPIRWDYLNNANRRGLYEVYSKLFRMRNIPQYLPAFTTSNVTYDLDGAFKWMKISSGPLNIVVIGNFDVTYASGSVAFQSAGRWYNYLQGGTKTATGASESITLKPGEYYVYVDKNVDSVLRVLPLRLVSFSGKRNSSQISLSWNTTNEVNVKNFVVERSFNGSDFTIIGSVKPNNTAESRYAFIDSDPFAVKAIGKIFYRLKMVDIDGAYSYSNIAVINPVGPRNLLTLYPNPVKGNVVNIIVDEAVQPGLEVKVTDASGRMFRRFTTSSSAGQVIPVDVKNLSNGVYILKVETGNKSFVQQFVIQH
jgi:hypothetical protein